LKDKSGKTLRMKTKSSIITAAIYGGISLIVAGIFFVLTLVGNYNWLTRVGGSIWIFLLCMIILMPLVSSLVKKRNRAG
jgi:hypothetical protein